MDERKTTLEAGLKGFILQGVIHTLAQSGLTDDQEKVRAKFEAYQTAGAWLSGDDIGEIESERAESFFREETAYYRQAEDLVREASWAAEYAERAEYCHIIAEGLYQLRERREER